MAQSVGKGHIVVAEYGLPHSQPFGTLYVQNQLALLSFAGVNLCAAKGAQAYWGIFLRGSGLPNEAYAVAIGNGFVGINGHGVAPYANHKAQRFAQRFWCLRLPNVGLSTVGKVVGESTVEALEGIWLEACLNTSTR